MICVILAAGYATRMYPLTHNSPKPLLPVRGKAILDWLLGDIDTIGEIKQHVIVSNHRYFGQFQKWADEADYCCPVTLVDDGSLSNETRRGAVGDLIYVIERLHLDDDLLVLAGDNLIDFSLSGFVSYFRQKDASCILCCEEADRAVRQRSGVLELDEEFRVVKMEEKPAHPSSRWITPPFYLYHRRDVPLLLTSVADGCGVDAPGSLFAWLSRRRKAYGWRMPGRRYDVGDLTNYQIIDQVYSGMERKIPHEK